MTIQWFPGHMAKALREAEKSLRLVDLVFEIVDARVPRSTRNPQLQKLAAAKEQILVLNKKDLADAGDTKKWLQKLTGEGQRAIAVSSSSGEGFSSLEKMAQAAVAGLRAKWVQKGRQPRAARAMVIGIPNVGKSAFINRLAGKARAKAENRPGVTRGQQWVKVGALDLLDTPGILWPKLENQNDALKLAFIGTIPGQILDLPELALELVSTLLLLAPGDLESRYRIDVSGQTPLEILEEIGRKRGLLVGGGKVDREKAAQLLLKEFRSGLLGKYTLDRPE